MNTKATYRKIGLKSCVAVCALAMLTSPMVMSDNSKSHKRHKPCNAASIAGDYGIQMQGTRPVPPPTGGTESVVGVVLRSFDGNGNFEQLDNIKGSVTGIAPNRPGIGTYEVNPDCTGATYFQPDPNNPNVVIQEIFVILDDGNEIRGIAQTPAPLMVSSVAKRVHER